MTACATTPADRAASNPASKEARDLVFQYRQQAAELSQIADHFESEVRWYVTRGMQGSKEAEESREMAKDFRSAANEAEDLARQYRAQIPHNQVY
jgi:hypothetical protein